MATTFKVLGQSAPSNTTTQLITAQTGYQVVVSSITAANRSTTATDYFYLRIAVANATSDNKQFVAFKVALAPQSTATLTLGITLDAADVVYAYSDNNTCSFNAFGSLNN
jgi:hypothetical protein